MRPRALVAGRLLELLRKRPPPPPMRGLPSARHGFRWRHPIGGGPSTPALPARLPRKAPRLLELEARATALMHRRRLMLERPELHRQHVHHDRALLVAARGYVLSHDAPPPPMAQASPYARWSIAASVPTIESDIKPHQWGHQARANDLRAMLGLEPRAWRHG